MIDHHLYRRLLEAACSRGGEYADIFSEHRAYTSLVLEDGKLEKIMAGADAGAGIRLIHQGRTAYAYTNDFSRHALLDASSAVSRASQEAPALTVLDLRTQRPDRRSTVSRPPDQVPIEQKIALVRSAERVARAVGKDVRQVSVIYRDTVQCVEIGNTLGSIASDERTSITFIVQVVAAGDGIIQSAHESVGGTTGFELFDGEKAEDLAVKAARRALMMLSAPKAPAGTMPVVISSSAGGTMIHEAIGHGLEADLAQQGLSVFSKKMGTRVASPLITVVDDGTLPGKRGSFCFDDEGTPSQRTVLVDRGTLTSYLYDRITAMKDGSASTGNGRRESYQHRPIPRMTNTFIAAGTDDPDSILRSVASGLFVEKIGGGQVNTVTGDFVFDVQEAYRIEQGSKGMPVRGATLTGNGPRVLLEIDMVGNDLGFSIGTCGKDAQGVPVSDAMPTLRIPEIVVGGAHASQKKS